MSDEARGDNVGNVGNDYRTASYWYRTSTCKARILIGCVLHGAQVVPSGECLRGEKPGAVDCSRLTPLAAGSFLACA